MSEWRALSDEEVADLVSRLRSLQWSWDPAEVDHIADEFGWKIEARVRGSFMLDVGFGMATGDIDVDKSGRVERISVAVCTPVSSKSPEARTWLQDTFARVAAAARVLGEPTQQVPGESPEVRWRGEESTVGIKRLSVQVNVFLARNDYIDDFDWAVSQGL